MKKNINFFDSLLSISLTLFCLLPNSLTFASEPIENVKRLSLSVLKERAFKAERDIYLLYSQLNEDDYYDIECHDVVKTGTILSTIECEPNYISSLVMHYGASTSIDSLWDVPNSVLKEHAQILQENMIRLSNENPELIQKVSAHSTLKKMIKERGD